MTKINVVANCGNAPKQLLLRDLQIAIVQGDQQTMRDSMTDDIVWQVVGGERFEGVEAVVAAIGDFGRSQATELTLHTILTHGREGAVSGEFVLADGRRIAFCDVCAFRGAKGGQVKAVQSYIIAL